METETSTLSSVQFSQSCLTLCDPWTVARQASLFLTNSWSLLKLMSIESVMPSNHLILCCPLLLLPSIFLALESFLMSHLFESDDQNTGASGSASVNIQGWSLRLTGLISLLFKGLSGLFSSTTVQRHQFFGVLPSLWSNSHNCM